MHHWLSGSYPPYASPGSPGPSPEGSHMNSDSSFGHFQHNMYPMPPHPDMPRMPPGRYNSGGMPAYVGDAPSPKFPGSERHKYYPQMEQRVPPKLESLDRSEDGSGTPDKEHSSPKSSEDSSGGLSMKKSTSSVTLPTASSPPKKASSGKRKGRSELSVKRKKNRDAAKLFRQRQKAYITALQEKLTDIEGTNSALKTKLGMVASENTLVLEQLTRLQDFLANAVLSFALPTMPGPPPTEQPLDIPLPSTEEKLS